jgi:ABC-2 type transport system permease protein
MGGFLTYKYGPFFAFLAGLWSILALSGTLAGEARRGSLDFVAVAPFGKRRIALEKLAAHVTAMALSMVFLASPRVAGSVFGIAELGDEIPLLSGVSGSPIWVGLMGLVSGAVAFALAPARRAGQRGRRRRRCPARLLHPRRLRTVRAGARAIAKVSWFHWTYDHVPLAGQFDWLVARLVGAHGRRASPSGSSSSPAGISGS